MFVLQKLINFSFSKMKGSGKTEFLALFVNWYVQCFAESDNARTKDLLIGVAAFTRDAIFNLLKRIEKVQKRHGFDASTFSIIYVHSSLENDRKFEPDSNMIASHWSRSYSTIRTLKKDETKRRIYVMGGTVWNWEKIRNKWKTFQGCDMMILDESTQVNKDIVPRLPLLLLLQPQLLRFFYYFLNLIHSFPNGQKTIIRYLSLMHY